MSVTVDGTRVGTVDNMVSNLVPVLSLVIMMFVIIALIKSIKS